jgi:hypothetical protein
MTADKVYFQSRFYEAVNDHMNEGGFINIHPSPSVRIVFASVKTKTRRGERNQESWGDPATRQS